MTYSLKGRKILVTGGSRGLGAAICEAFAREGSNVVVNYNSDLDSANKVAASVEGHGTTVKVIQADVGSQAECQRLVREATSALGGLDVVIHNAGWTNFEKFGDLDAMSEEQWDKCWAMNVKAIHHLFRAAKPTFNDNAEGGVFLITSSVAGLAPVGSSMGYSVTKTAGLHLMKCLAQTQGPKIRVNAVCPGWLPTEWGYKYDEEAIKNIKSAAALKRETYIDETADAFVFLAKSTSVTGEKFKIDAGFILPTIL